MGTLLWKKARSLYLRSWLLSNQSLFRVTTNGRHDEATLKVDLGAGCDAGSIGGGGGKVVALCAAQRDTNQCGLEALALVCTGTIRVAR